MIENLKMKIPWKSISTSSVEIELSGLYLLLTPKSKNSWDKLEIDFIKRRREFLINYGKNLMDMLFEKLKTQGKEEKGYFGKLI